MSDTEIPPKPIPAPTTEPAATAEPAASPKPSAPTSSAATKPPPPSPPPAAKPAAAWSARDLPPPQKQKSSIWPFLGLIAFLLLAAGEAYLYKLHQSETSDAAQIAALQSQIATLQQTATQAQSQPQPPSPSLSTSADLAEKFAALTAQVSAMQTQLATDHGALTTVQAANTNVTQLNAKMTLLNRLESARIALESGQPVGDIPGAPTALAKFAATPPPTLSQLILAYPAAEAAANNASVDKQEKGTIWQQALARVENLVTISNGNHVIVGAPAAAITAQAGEKLNAGDLAGAVAILTNGLSQSTQAALGPWLPNAEALLAARSAIVTLADQN